MSETSHVLARKYRPQVFADLIGQEVLVQTITNAIASNRLAHAYMLTGIRGVGKTTSARIIAKGLNCIGPDGTGGMTPNPCGQCRHCIDIAHDAHMDVIEIDAASNTGVDNVREIIEGAKYNPVSARFKIYIIDEVHMLSRQAFNALLKTLEEPPERIKFIFATTEIRKVPVTILSRCQRFDLKRVGEEKLVPMMQRICAQENAQAEENALRLIARAGEGSVRDSLSLLDQAMTQLEGHITAESVRGMMGLADQGMLLRLYETLMQGDMSAVLSHLSDQEMLGADSLTLAQDLLELTHRLTRYKIMPNLLEDVTLTQYVRETAGRLSRSLSMATLTSAWQMLLKGISEIKQADRPAQALEMVLIRLAYLSEMPSVAQLAAEIKKKSKEDALGRNNAEHRTQALQGTNLESAAGVNPKQAQKAFENPLKEAVLTSSFEAQNSEKRADASIERAVPFDASSSYEKRAGETPPTQGAGPQAGQKPEGSANQANGGVYRLDGAQKGVSPIERRETADTFTPESVEGQALEPRDSTVPSETAPNTQETQMPTQAPVPKKAALENNFSSLKDIAALARSKNERILAYHIEACLRPVSVVPGLIICSLTEQAPRTLVSDMSQFLNRETALSWQVKVVSDAGGALTTKEQQVQDRRLLQAELERHPMVASVLSVFPDAKIERIQERVLSDSEEANSDKETSASPQETGTESGPVKETA